MRRNIETFLNSLSGTRSRLAYCLEFTNFATQSLVVGLGLENVGFDAGSALQTSTRVSYVSTGDILRLP